MRLQFDIDVSKFVKMKKMMTYISRYYNKNSRLFMIVQMDQEQVSTKVSGSMRFFLNGHIFKTVTIFKSINYLSRLYLKFRGNESIAVFQILEAYQFFQYFSSNTNLIPQKIQCCVKKGSQEEAMRYLQINQKNNLSTSMHKFQLGPPITLQDCDFWQPEEDPILNAVNIQTIYFKKLISCFITNKAKIRFIININKQQNLSIFGLIGQLSYSVRSQGYLKIETIGGINQFNLEGIISEANIQNFMNIFEGGEIGNMMYTKQGELIFGYQQQQCAKYIKFSPSRSVKQQN